MRQRAKMSTGAEQTDRGLRGQWQTEWNSGLRVLLPYGAWDALCEARAILAEAERSPGYGTQRIALPILGGAPRLALSEALAAFVALD